MLLLDEARPYKKPLPSLIPSLKRIHLPQLVQKLADADHAAGVTDQGTYGVREVVGNSMVCKYCLMMICFQYQQDLSSTVKLSQSVPSSKQHSFF